MALSGMRVMPKSLLKSVSRNGLERVLNVYAVSAWNTTHYLISSDHIAELEHISSVLFITQVFTP